MFVGWWTPESDETTYDQIRVCSDCGVMVHLYFLTEHQQWHERMEPTPE